MLRATFQAQDLETIAVACTKHLTNTILHEQHEITLGKFTLRIKGVDQSHSTSQLRTKGLVSGLYTLFSKQSTQLIYKFLQEQLNLEGQ